MINLLMPNLQRSKQRYYSRQFNHDNVIDEDCSIDESLVWGFTQGDYVLYEGGGKHTLCEICDRTIDPIFTVKVLIFDFHRNGTLIERPYIVS